MYVVPAAVLLSVTTFWIYSVRSIVLALFNNVFNELLEIWVDVEWLKEQQHQIKYETVLFLQEKTMFNSAKLLWRAWVGPTVVNLNEDSNDFQF